MGGNLQGLVVGLSVHRSVDEGGLKIED